MLEGALEASELKRKTIFSFGGKKFKRKEGNLPLFYCPIVKFVHENILMV